MITLKYIEEPGTHTTRDCINLWVAHCDDCLFPYIPHYPYVSEDQCIDELRAAGWEVGERMLCPRCKGFSSHAVTEAEIDDA